MCKCMSILMYGGLGGVMPRGLMRLVCGGGACVGVEVGGWCAVGGHVLWWRWAAGGRWGGMCWGGGGRGRGGGGCGRRAPAVDLTDTL